uniref:SJCHGC07279 protein n=1 Tax=Schistosoma japonicum TaxID=6182 RepID=Q5DI72_SCHJA|nr:SJCHGC07279 protein [Schistosoma japonicum]
MEQSLSTTGDSNSLFIGSKLKFLISGSHIWTNSVSPQCASLGTTVPTNHTRDGRTQKACAATLPSVPQCLLTGFNLSALYLFGYTNPFRIAFTYYSHVHHPFLYSPIFSFVPTSSQCRQANSRPNVSRRSLFLILVTYGSPSVPSAPSSYDPLCVLRFAASDQHPYVPLGFPHSYPCLSCPPRLVLLHPVARLARSSVQ